MTGFDTDLVFPHIQRLKASAGSGKTHALTRRYLQFYLSDRIPSSDLRHLMAVTFTNKAAFVMKARIVEWLKKIHFQSDAKITADMAGSLSLDGRNLPDLAREKLDHIFQNYLDFCVRTIDSFLTGLAQGSAYELGLPPRADVMIDSRDHLQLVLASLLDQIGKDEILTSDFFQTVEDLFSFSDQLTWDLRSLISTNVTDLRNIESTSGKMLYLDPGLADTLARCRRQSTQAGLTLAEHLDQLQLKWPNASEKLHEFLSTGDPHAFMSTSLFSKSSVEELVRKKDIGLITPSMKQSWSAFRERLEQLVFATASAEFEPYMRIMERIEQGMASLARQENIVYLDRLSMTLRDYLQTGGVPSAFFYWGERVPHFFLDEFQDTSISQWEALRPLLEEALSKGGSLFFVGDKKQAIYRFRGGSARLFDDVLEDFPFERYDAALPSNWRSRQALVDFFNDVFSEGNLLAWFRETIHSQDNQYSDDDFVRSIFDVFKDASQEYVKDGGYVRVESREFPKGVPLEQGMSEIIDEMTDSILPDLIERGYSYGDITFLVRKNKEAALVSQVLMGKGLPVASEVTLTLASSLLVNELISFLRFLDSPIDSLSFASFLTGEIFCGRAELTADHMFRFLNDSARRKESALYVAFRARYPDTWNDHIQPFFSTVGYLPPYDLLQRMLHHFAVVSRFPLQEIFVYHLLELLKMREGEGENSLGDFLQFWSQNQDDPWMQVPLAENAGAIRVLTIHKAKGLGFPVVILPFPYLVSHPRSWSVVEKDGRLMPIRIPEWAALLSPRIAEIRKAERLADISDELCAFYVALTRAADELYIFPPTLSGHQWSRKRKIPISGHLTSVHEWGSQRIRGPRKDVAPSEPSHYPVLTDWNRKLHLKRGNFARTCSAEQRQALKRGTLIHRTLANGILPGVQTAGIADHNREAVDPVLTNLMRHPLIKRLLDFNSDVTIENEVTLLDENGELHLIDRILIGPAVVTIVEWKTGAEDRRTHQEQVRAYGRLLASIYPGRKIEGYLVYVDEGAIEEVSW